MHVRFILIALLIAGPCLAQEKAAQEVQTEVTVEVAQVIKTTLSQAVTVYGRVEADPGTADQPPASARLSAAVAGIITEVHGSEGQPVKKGTVLFRLDSRAVDAAVATAELSIDYAEKNAERQAKLMAVEGTSEKQVLEAQQALATAKAELASAKVQQSLLRGVAPLDGTLIRFTARPGEAADASTVLAEIVDMKRLTAVVQVPRVEAAKLRLGQRVNVSGTQTFKYAARVIYISPQVDVQTDTVEVRLSMPRDGDFKLGDFIKASIITETHENVLCVVDASLYTDYHGYSTLYIVTDGVAKKMRVKTGLRQGGLVEVSGDGLTEGMVVITHGSYKLPDETKVSIYGQ